MSDINFNMGALKGMMQLKLHTYQATRLWTGREGNKEKGIARIMGIAQFFSLVRIIDIAASQDDPYADACLIELEKRLTEGKQTLLALTEKVQSLIQGLPEGINVEECLNIQPALIPVNVSNKMSYLAVYLLNAYDDFARHVLLANHIALITNSDRYYWLDEGGKVVRRIFGYVQRYKFSGVTREDFKQGNAKWNEAVNKFGELPKDVLDGTYRSNYAPVIRNGQSGTNDDASPVISDEEMAHDTENETEERQRGE